MPPYPIPKAATRVETRAGNSRFIATLLPVGSVEDARAAIRSVREEMPDATHHVYAFRVGFGASVTEGVSDDGEPSGTSGPPVLAILRASGIGDVLIVVTRYYGGTKLGTGGLVQAYSDAARTAIAVAETVLKVARTHVTITVPYAQFERLRQALLESEALIVDEQFEEGVTIRAAVPTDMLEALKARVRDLSAGAARIQRDD